MCSSYTSVSDASREITIGNYGLSDSSFFSNSTWYRFTDANSFNFLPETAPSYGACGGGNTGWLNGNHPTIAQGQVSSTLCFVVSGVTNTNCNIWTTVTAVQCFGFFLYNFPYGLPAGMSYPRVCTTNVTPANLNPLANVGTCVRQCVRAVFIHIVCLFVCLLCLLCLLCLFLSCRLHRRRAVPGSGRQRCCIEFVVGVVHRRHDAVSGLSSQCVWDCCFFQF